MGSCRRQYEEVGFCQIPQLKDYVILHVRIDDNASSDILPVIPLTNGLLEVARRKGWNVFVHWYKISLIGLIICSTGGVSRSPAVIVAYLMQHLSYPFEEALKLVSGGSSRIKINSCNFIHSL